ncbi:hypothetical protein HMPREF0262_02134 [Clostridium sp. ATCC 29733]|nr:hypothetical protein HMPREF0262_02134 [Clostridium sp. ATCC 29733]
MADSCIVSQPLCRVIPAKAQKKGTKSRHFAGTGPPAAKTRDGARSKIVLK